PKKYHQMITERRSKGESTFVEVEGLVEATPSDPKALEQAGIRAADAADKVRFRFPVRDLPPVEAFTVAGFADGRADEGLRLPSPDQIRADQGELEITLSASALTG